MADEVAQAPAVQGVETTQTLLHLQLQVFPGFILCRLYPPFVSVHFASCYVSLFFLLCTFASRYLASSPSIVVFTVSRPLVFWFASYVAAY